MAKKKQVRKYVTISVLREIMDYLDLFIKESAYGKIYSSKADFIHRAVNEKLEDYFDRESRLETKKLYQWYGKNMEKLQKRGINSWEDLLTKAIDYSERFDEARV